MPIPRPGILATPPYQLGESTIPGVARVIELASNECAAEPSPRALAAYRDAATQLRRYPDGGAVMLRQAIGRRYALDPDRIVCGNGSEDLIANIARAYAGAGDEVVVSQYGYLLFQLAATIGGAAVVTAPASALAPDVDALLAAVGPRTRILFLANPNNPTGACLPEGEIRRLHRTLPAEILLVLDAAYADYVAAADYGSGLRLAEDAPNIVVLRTFSKAYGLAGLRVGWAYGPPAVIEVLNRVRPPSNLAAPAQAAAAAALADDAHVTRVVAGNAATRDRFAAALEGLGVPPAPSEGNFVLVPFPREPARDAAAAHAHLRRHGILVRPMRPYGLDHCLRITIGTAEEMEIVAGRLAEFLGGRHSS